ncbi:MAG: RNA 2',3'-cyclic phosphodiesterase [Candidatus Eisenbacteria bacterium]|nr:RNA 2',3'-cyclic phosphodiesterase [Candidatus Eisenbacteria bacterium]
MSGGDAKRRGGRGARPEAPPGTVRAFFAVFPPPDVESALADYVATLRRELRDVAWVKSGNLHLTLRFLGDVTPPQVEAAGKALDAATAGRPGFEVCLKDVGAFPSMQQPRVVWLGVEAGRGPLVDLAAGLEARLADAGLGRADKPFAAHLTVGRVREYLPPAALPALLQRHPCPGFRFRAASVALIRSQLQAGGSVYTPIREVRLA